jgi:hypothetical protein
VEENAGTSNSKLNLLDSGSGAGMTDWWMVAGFWAGKRDVADGG